VIILGFDTSTRATAVGLRLADGSALELRDDPATGEQPGHASRLLRMTAELLAQAGMAWTALERVAVGRGPGRFTGLRVGVATARGLAQSLAADLVGVSTLEALAQAAIAGGQGDRVLAVIDALRGEVFSSGFAASGNRPVCELALARPLGPEALADLLRGGASPGAEGGRWLAVGDGAVRYRTHLEPAAIVPADCSPLHRVDARAICELGARTAASPGYQELVPDYRRLADAEGARRPPGAPEPVTELEGARP
jgi:tRNA threonylcarbamoyladenosine biosynthesis protein TsaB